MIEIARDPISDWQQHEWDLLFELRRCGRLFELVRDAAGSEFQVQTQLRRQFPEHVVRAALSVAELRRRAAGKFSRASEMWFDRKGLEQSTAEAVARHKAQRFQGRVWDYCCGIGADAFAFAQNCPVIAVDTDPTQCLRTKWNAEVYGVGAALQVLAADVECLTDRSGLVHIDPDRRPNSAASQPRGRTLRIEDCVPGLEFLRRLATEFEGGAIKLSPASNFLGKFPQTEIELVSLDGECKEATIWFGGLRTATPFRATVLPSGASLAGDPLEANAAVSRPHRYIYDPNPAVVRAGLVDILAERYRLHRLDAAEEYLSSDDLIACPFVRSFRVREILPNSEREIRAFFRRHDFGQVEIKCRRIPVRADALRRKLHLPGADRCVLIVARLAGKAHALICERADVSFASDIDQSDLDDL